MYVEGTDVDESSHPRRHWQFIIFINKSSCIETNKIWKTVIAMAPSPWLNAREINSKLVKDLKKFSHAFHIEVCLGSWRKSES